MTITPTIRQWLGGKRWLLGAAVAALGLTWAGAASTQAHAVVEVHEYAPARVFQVVFYDHRHDIWRVYGTYNHRGEAERAAEHIRITRHRPAEVCEIVRL